MATDAEKRKLVAAARATVRRMEYRAELEAWLARASTQPRIRYKTYVNQHIGLQHDDTRVVRR